MLPDWALLDAALPKAARLLQRLARGLSLATVPATGNGSFRWALVLRCVDSLVPLLALCFGIVANDLYEMLDSTPGLCLVRDIRGGLPHVQGMAARRVQNDAHYCSMGAFRRHGDPVNTTRSGPLMRPSRLGRRSPTLAPRLTGRSRVTEGAGKNIAAVVVGCRTQSSGRSRARISGLGGLPATFRTDTTED